ncbi:hypothetical protein ACWIG4_30455, partial [Streptomyces sp. NPDC002248]
VGSASDVAIGINSGTYQDEAGVSVLARLYMGNDFIDMSPVTASGSDRNINGGFLSLSTTKAQVGRYKGTLNDNDILFSNTGSMYFSGEVNYFNSNNNALLMGGVSYSGGPYGGVDISYGATQTSAPRVIAQLNDTTTAGNGRGSNVYALTTTGFSMAFQGSSFGGDMGICWWAWRMGS